MSRLAFQEKLLWAQLIGIPVTIVVYAHFFVHTGPGHHYFHALVLFFLLVFGSVRLYARRSGNVVEDERDRSIAATGARWSNLILWVGLVILLVLYWDHGGMHSINLLMGILFHLLVLAAMVRIVRELVAYRMRT